MVGYLAIAYILMYVILLTIGLFLPIKLRGRCFKFLTAGAVLSACVLSMHVKIFDKESDLYRQFLWIEEMRSGGIDELMRHFKWSPLWGRDLYMYLISLTDNNYLILTTNSIVVYGIMYWMLMDYNRRYECNGKIIAFSVITFILFCTYIHVTVFIRFPLAAALCALAVYKREEKHCSLWKTAVLFILAMSIHHGSALMLLSFFLSLATKKWPKIRGAVYCTILVLAVSVVPLGSLMSRSGIKIIHFLGRSILGYSHIQSLNSRSVALACMLFPIELLLAIWNTRDDKPSGLFSYAEVLVLLSLASVGFQRVSERLLIALAFVSISIFNKCFCLKRIKNKVVYQLCLVGIVGVFLLMAYYDLYVFNGVFVVC